MNRKKYIHLLWKRISISDWIVLGVGVVFLLGFYLFFKRDTVYITATFKVTDENPLYANTLPNTEYASAFVPGDGQRDLFGHVIAEIKRVERYSETPQRIDLYDVTPERNVVYLDIKIKTVYNPRDHTYSAQGKNIVFGESFTFSFARVKFKALVVDFPGFRGAQSTQTMTTVVRAQLRNDSRGYSDVYGVPDFVARAVKKGDITSDDKGNPLVRVLDVSVAPAKRMVVNTIGQPFMVDDPYLKDVYVTLEIATKEINGKLYMFDYKPILINTVVPLNLKTINLSPVITEIIK